MFRIRKVFRGGRSSRPTHASAIRVHGRYALMAGTNGRDAAEGGASFRDVAGRYRGAVGCDELATEGRAFNLASCCTCAPAMLAKPRF